jgi:adenylylsulfate kinase
MPSRLVVWLTGLPGAGKTTLARLVEAEFRRRLMPVQVLDSEEIRKNLSAGLGFSRADRETHIRRVGFVANILSQNGVNVVVAAISPYESLRQEVRAAQHDIFVEIFVDCSFEVLIERDPKGLYRRALAGEIASFSGISDPYERPLKPEIVVHTDTEDPQQSASRIISWLEEHGYLR